MVMIRGNHSEHSIQQAIINYLRNVEAAGRCYFFRSNSFKGAVIRPGQGKGWLETGRKGCPDIVVCYDGQFIGVEVKSETGKLSKDQKDARLTICGSGGKYIVARSVDDVEEIIK